MPDFEMLDAKIASALKQIISSVHLRRRVIVEEQRAQNYDRFFRGRQNAYSMTTLEQPDLLTQHKAYQIYSVYAYTMMMFKISTRDVTWKVCTSENYRILFTSTKLLLDEDNGKTSY